MNSHLRKRQSPNANKIFKFSQEKTLTLRWKKEVHVYIISGAMETKILNYKYISTSSALNLKRVIRKF